MRVLVLIAGTNEPSNAETLTDAFIKGVQNVNGEVLVTKLRLKDLSINHFTLEYYNPTCTLEDDFCTVQNHIQDADGIVIATPIWNFSVPAHLKNLIDRIGGFALDEETHSKGQLNGKPFFLIFTGGAPLIAWKAMMHVTTVHLPEAIKYYGGAIVGRHFEPHCMLGRGKFGLVVHERPKSLERMKKRGATFAHLVRRFAETGKLPFRHRFRLCLRGLMNAIANRAMYRISPYS